MTTDNLLFSLLSQLMWSVPTLLVCVIGVVMLRTRSLSNKAKNFGSAGLILVALGSLAGVAFSSFISSGGIDYSSSNFRFLQMGYSALMQILHAISLAFLIVAIGGKGKATLSENDTQNPYS